MVPVRARYAFDPMPKSLVQIVALLLVPCLLSEPFANLSAQPTPIPSASRVISPVSTEALTTNAVFWTHSLLKKLIPSPSVKRQIGHPASLGYLWTRRLD